MLLYGTVIVVIGQSLWSIGFRTSLIATASLVGSFTPIFGILAAYLVLGELHSNAQYGGGVVILLGLFVGQVGIRYLKVLVLSLWKQPKKSKQK
jgi:drug/metabolite transporter (DMT)-like permease